MKNQDLHRLFIQELEDMYDSERQIVAFLPKPIVLASSIDLKEALAGHLKQTEDQIARIEEIFEILGLIPKGKVCEAMKGLLKEAEGIVRNKDKSAVLDAAIISAAQKIEHYEIASYGTLRNFASHLQLDSKVIRLLQDSLDEEGSADKKLTKIAEGSFFSGGINEEAVAVSGCCGGSHKK